MSCVFCKIIAGAEPAFVVHSDENVIAFLDIHPLFPGHVLITPREHVEVLADLADSLLLPLFSVTQKMSIAVKSAMCAEGTFVAMNNKVSQSVPHLHVHVVPRKKGDGLKGFFWPRYRYKGEEEMKEVAEKIKDAL